LCRPLPIPDGESLARRGDCERENGQHRIEILVYPGTEHGFNRQGYPPYNEPAATLARERTQAHFSRLLV
jgi:carboxymethylenebutenolidase